MFKRLLAIALCAIFNAGLAWAAEEGKAPQLYPRDQLKKWDREKVAGGEGTLYGEFSHTRNDAPKDWAIKEIGSPAHQSACTSMRRTRIPISSCQEKACLPIRRAGKPRSRLATSQ